MRSFLIDSDTASGDAMAQGMPLGRPHVQAEAVTVVAGNVLMVAG